MLTLNAEGTAVWAFIDFLVLIALIVTFCQQQSRRAEESDGWGDDDDTNPCGTFLCNVILIPVCIVLLFFHMYVAGRSSI